jgi:uncharacterized protein YndB with AHSA1/START domain
MYAFTIPERKSAQDVLVSREIDINAPRETVFDVVVDLTLFVELEENVKKVDIVSETKEGKGLKSRWELENPSTGAHWVVHEEIVHYDKPHQYSYIGKADDGNDYAGTHTLSENEDGSTHLLFNEMFYFDADPQALGEVVSGMLHKVKQEAERRHAGTS